MFSFFPHQNWGIVIILTVIVDYFRSNITSHHNSHVLSQCVDVVVIVLSTNSLSGSCEVQ